MSAAGHSSPPPTSAAVLEFICLFTNDLRRKQKRWQDGRLKYHTFNNRVMVYDDRGNFVGDMHWRHDWDLVEGEEVQLERGGVIVQVQELSSRCEQDLSELLEKRAKEKEQRQMQAVARTPGPSDLPRTVVRPVLTRPIPPNNAQVRPRALHQVIGTPSGHLGRAILPKESPFEQRQQAAESPDLPAAKRRKYEPPPSKSGYASALFGQALTLSATPTSSMPLVKRQQIPEPDPSQEEEHTMTETVHKEHKPPLREQPKVSRHFNQSSERARSTDTGSTNLLSHRYMENNDKPVQRKKERGLPGKQKIERRREPTPVDLGMIDIDSPDETPAKKSKDPSRAGARVVDQSKASNNNNDKRAKTSSRHTSDTTRMADDRVDLVSEIGMGFEKDPETQARNENSKRPKMALPNSVVKRAVATSSVAKDDGHPEAAIFSPREPTVHVTELRIKPRRKRGLMMMSDLFEKPHEQPPGDLTMSHAVSDAMKTKEVEETDHSARTLSRTPHGEPRWRKHDRKCMSSPKLTNSTELGGPEETVSSPSPDTDPDSVSEDLGPQNEHTARDNGSIQLGEDDDPFMSLAPPRARAASTDKLNGRTVAQRNISKTSGVGDVSVRLPDSLNATSSENTRIREIEGPVDDMESVASIQEDDRRPAFQGKMGDTTVEVIDNAVDVVSTTSPRGKHSDPYRIPSSSPEDSPEFLTRVSSNVAKAAQKADRSKVLTSKEVREEQQSVDKGNRPSKIDKAARRSRAILRNVVLDEDDDLDAPYAAQEPVKIGVEGPPGTDYDSNPKTSEKRRRSKQTTKRKPKGLEAPFEDTTGSEIGANPRKKQTKPKQAKRASKRKSPVQESECDFESEVEQPFKRRRATRKLPTRAAEPEETPLPSEQEDSEEDTSPGRSRRKKNNTSEDRPRLEVIKKSVKSRELVGFDLSALNAPLGPRGIGIGMPFSILSSPVNEPIRRKMDSPVTIEPSSDSLLAAIEGQMPVTNSDVMQTIAEADELTVRSRSPEYGQGAQLTNNVSVPLIPEDHKLDNAAEVPQSLIMSKTLQQIDYRDSPVADSATITRLTEAVSPDSQRQTSTTSRAIDIAPEQSEDVTEPVAGEEVTLATRITTARTLNPPAKKPIATTQPQNTSHDLGLSSGEVSKETEVDAVIEARIAALPTLPAYKVPEQKLSPALQRQVSSTANTATETKISEVEEHAAETNLSVVSALPAFKRHERKTPPALSRQASLTADVNTEVELQHSGNEENTRETAVKESLESFKVSAEKPRSASFRRQAPSFKPPTKAKGDVAMFDNGLKVQCDQTNANILETKFNKATSTNLTGVPSRSDSGSIEIAEVKTATSSSDVKEGTRTDPEGISSAEKQKRAGLQRTVSSTRRINNLTVEPSRPAIMNDPTLVESSTKPGPNARIANPASRGRKAAVKSDAKGPVPQRMLPPTQPFAAVPISTADFALTQVEEPPKDPERPKKKMTFPGFQSARGEGPWSREAFDLLESGRPE
ncbi:hypothetical protein N0V93_009050 [Gnomoniopsis smithogilvyi]|uniref:5'-3' DNA helicase ZGRF1-like N-terminal domain-containing protein n=1 Tax=Gnomoniopsis smithogilvyi TaxID=1191159 RepID=A0A9W9CTB8_9PEZI|nr:hypothetical protein N0V93_009050 [Gnomoniopsis smithogilvyi]